MEQLTQELICTALSTSEGNVTSAAKSLGVTRATLYNYFTRYPELKTVLKDARETMIDEAESALLKAIKRGEGWAVCFTLKTIGRSRGYIEKHDLNVDVVITREIAEDAVEWYIKKVAETEERIIEDPRQALVEMKEISPKVYEQIAPVLESSLTH